MILKSECSYKVANTYISKWHYSGKTGNTSIAICAKFNGGIIAICVFGAVTRIEIAKKQEVSHKEILELSRFVIHPKYHKKNFASWLISRCIKHIKANANGVKLLVSFADPSYNHDGGIYKASNWIYDGRTAPNYWYIDNGRTIIHKKSIWEKAKASGMKETEYADKYGLKKVVGEGKFRYIYKLK